MAKKEKPKKPAAPDADGAPEGEGGAPAKKKMAGKTLVLFIILPAVLVLGGGGAAAVMLMGGGGAKAEAGEHAAADGEHPAPEAEHAEAPAAGGEHAEGAPAAGLPEDEAAVGRMLPCESGSPCYYAMPKVVVNLAGVEGQRSPYMELELSLESSAPSTFTKIPELMPRLKDQLNAFLRELRVEDLSGSGGTFTLRRELLKRFNTVLEPKRIDAVLIEGMLIQ